MNYRNDLHRLMSQPESWFSGHTPNWPKDRDAERFDSITITVKINCSMNGAKGLNRVETAKLCRKLERTARGKSKRVVSAIL